MDPAGTWASLNWITVAHVRQVCQREFGVQPRFDREISFRFVRRALTDPSFQRRHGVVMRRRAAALDATGLIALAKAVPAIAQPAMSCRLAACVAAASSHGANHVWRQSGAASPTRRR